MPFTSAETFYQLLQLELGLTDTNLYPSAPATAIDLTEPTSVSSDFYYKHYTPDERTADPDTEGVIDISPASEDLEQAKRRLTLPRSAVIKIQVPEWTPIKTIDGYTHWGWVSWRKMVENNFMRRFPEKIVFEGAVANTRFSSLILQDNQIDDTFYKTLDQSVAFKEAYSKTGTDSELGNYLDRYYTSPMAYASATPSTIRKVMSNYQPKGIAYASTDARREVIAEALRDVRFCEFNFTVNNAIAHNIVLAGLEDRGNIYQDELIGVLDDAKEVQDYFVTTVNPAVVDGTEYDLDLAAVFLEKKDTIEYDYSKGVDEASYPIGLYVEKHEIQTLDDGSFKSTKCEPIIIPEYGNFNILDSQIRYGATYIYRVRIVYCVAYEATVIDHAGMTDPEPVFAAAMIASQGLKTQVICIENIPPDPPRNLTFNYDFSDNSLDVFWEEPTNSQRDVVRYQVLKRSSVDEPFALVRELDFDNSTDRVVPLEVAPPRKIERVPTPRKWIKDRSFKRSTSEIYACAAIDARGLTSGYSEQIRVSFDRFKNKIETSRVSPPRAPKPYPNLYLDKDLFVDTMKSSGATRMRIFFDPEYFDVLQTIKVTGESTIGGKTGGKGKASTTPKETTIRESLDLISEQYKLQIINVDLQDSKIFNINIDKLTFDITEIPVTSATIKTIL